MKQQLIKSSMFRMLEIIIVTIISIVLTPYLIGHLGDDNYGLWILILSALGWFNFLELGFADAVQRNIVLALEKSDHHRINVIFSVAVVLFALLGTIAVSCVLTLAVFPELLGIGDELQSTASIALAILAFKVFLDFIMNCYHGFYIAYLRMDIDANLSALNTIFKSILVYFLIIDLNVYGAVAATIMADITTHSMKVYFAKKLHPNFKLSLQLVKISEIKELFVFSKHLIIAGVAGNINRKIDPILISHLLGLKFVALYNVVNTLVNQVEQLVLAVVDMFQPVFTRKVARGDDIKSIYQQVTRINYFTVVLFYTPLAILAEDFILLWIGPEYAVVSNLAYILGFAYICRTISRPIRTLLLAQANHQLISLVNIIGAIVNVTLSLWLGLLWGLEGIAVATVCAFFISDVVLYLVLLKRFTSLPVTRSLGQFIMTSALYTTLVLVGKEIMLLFPPLSWLELFLAGGVCVTLTLCIVWPFVLKVETKKHFIGMILKRVT